MVEQGIIFLLPNLCVYVQIHVQCIAIHCLNYVYAKYALSMELTLILTFI